MAVNLSPLGGAGTQFFSNNGVPLSGGLLYTYLAGSTLPATTYTSNTGTTTLANPIVLDSAGRIPTGEIWLADTINYKFVLKDATDALIATWDNISGINANYITFTAYDYVATATAGQTVFTLPLIYVPNTNNLAVYVNGIKQIVSVNYTETNTNTITFLAGLNINDIVEFSTATPVAANATDAANVSYTEGSTNAVTTNVQSKLRESVSVMDFGAVGDGITDDTAAFNAAIATGKKVIVPIPSVGYLVNGITVVDNMVIEGEKSGVSLGPLLIVSTTNGCAFLQGAANAFQVDISNLACKAKTGVTGARFFKQSDTTYYSAYTRFSKIETYLDLQVSYDGFFIFATWDKCRDGYLGTGTNHTAITSNAVAYGQTNTTNINLARDCQFFGSVGGNAAVDISYGTMWKFDNCDFENISVPAFRARGVFLNEFNNCWFESITAAQVITLAEYPATAAGSSATFTNCFFLLSTITSYVVNLETNCVANFRDNDFNLVPTGVTQANDGTKIAVNQNSRANSGTGVAGFFTGMGADTYLNGKRFLNSASNNGSGANIQNAGLISSSLGFTTSVATSVTTSFVTIATSNTGTGVGGLCFINGYNTSGGAQGAWLVLFYNSGTPVVVSSSDATATTPTFQTSGSNLQMKTTTGTLSINTALLV